MKRLLACPWLLACLVPFVAEAVRTVRDPLDVNHDVAMYLECARQMLEGRVPYVDFIDLNPPLVMALAVPPAWLAAVTGLSPILAFHLFVCSAAVLALAALDRVLRESRLPSAARLRAVALLAAGWFALGGTQFGQREHLFVLGLLPLVALRLARRSQPGLTGGGWAAAAIGAGAGLGAFLKPHFLGLVALLEGALALQAWFASREPCQVMEGRPTVAPRVWCAGACPPLAGRRLGPSGPLLASRGHDDANRRGRWTPEVLAFCSIGVGYAVWWASMPPESLAAFFGRWLPLIAAGYRSYDGLNPGSAIHALAAAAACVGGLAVAVRCFVGSAAGPAALPAGALAVGGFAAYVMQAKGWSYQAIPALAGGLASLAALALALTGALAGSASPLRRKVARVLPTALAAGLIALHLWVIPAPRGNPFLPVLETWSRPGDAVLFLSTSVTPGFPTLVQAGRRPGSRFLFLFPLPMIYRLAPPPAGELPYHSPLGQVPAEEVAFLQDLLADVQARRPRIVLVDRGRAQACPPGFVLYDYLYTIGFLRKLAPLYRRVEPVWPYEVFVRLSP